MPVNILDVLREGAQRSDLRRSSSNMGKALQSLVWRDAFINQTEYAIGFTNTVLKVRQQPNGEVNGLGTGLTVWPAAYVLLKYLEHTFATTRALENKRVIELGCGTGAVGVAAAILGANVVLTDQEQILFHIHENVAANKVHAEVCAYNWGEALTGPLAIPVDMVLISDCILPKLYPIEPLVDAISLLCNRESVVVLISFEHRYYEHYDPKKIFWKLIQDRNLIIRSIPIEKHHPNYNADDIEIWEITLK